MSERIERDIFITRDCVVEPIHYVQGMNIVPVKFNLKDFTIPAGSTAIMGVYKPNGRYEYVPATVQANSVEATPTTSMFDQSGKYILQMKATKDEHVLITFGTHVYVERNVTSPAEPGTNNKDIFGGMSFSKLTRAEYNALDPKDENTQYVVMESDDTVTLYIGSKQVSGGGGGGGDAAKSLKLDGYILSLLNSKGDVESSVNLVEITPPFGGGVSVYDELISGYAFPEEGMPVSRSTIWQDDDSEKTQSVITISPLAKGYLVVAVMHTNPITIEGSGWTKWEYNEDLDGNPWTPHIGDTSRYLTAFVKPLRMSSDVREQDIVVNQNGSGIMNTKVIMLYNDNPKTISKDVISQGYYEGTDVSLHGRKVFEHELPGTILMLMDVEPTVGLASSSGGGLIPYGMPSYKLNAAVTPRFGLYYYYGDEEADYAGYFSKIGGMCQPNEAIAARIWYDDKWMEV